MEGQFVLDANIFIEAKNRYYAFDLCPGFWDSLLHHGGQRSLLSIDRVQKELTDGSDSLATWAAGPGASLFELSTDAGVLQAYGRVIEWVNRQPDSRWTAAAKVEFARGADGWVIAYAIAHGGTVTTHEVDSNKRGKVKIPNVCREFGVGTIDTFKMLLRLKVCFEWFAQAP